MRQCKSPGVTWTTKGLHNPSDKLINNAPFPTWQLFEEPDEWLSFKHCGVNTADNVNSYEYMTLLNRAAVMLAYLTTPRVTVKELCMHPHTVFTAYILLLNSSFKTVTLKNKHRSLTLLYYVSWVFTMLSYFSVKASNNRSHPWFNNSQLWWRS